MGNNTGINYAKDFDEYLQILLTGLRKKKKSILDLFREWDAVVFPNSDSSLVGQEKSETSSGLKSAMEMLEADEVEEDPPATEGSGGEGEVHEAGERVEEDQPAAGGSTSGGEAHEAGEGLEAEEGNA